MGKTFGIVALIFGILSLPLGLISAATEGTLGFFGMPEIGTLIIVLGWISIVIAILFGIIGIIIDESKGMGIAGLILGIIGLIIRLVYTAFINFFMGLFP